MRTVYRGHEITVTREKSMMGETMLFYGIFRQADGFECDSGFSSGGDTVRDMVNGFKKRVDEELASADPWGENDLSTYGQWRN